MCYVAGLATISPKKFFIANVLGRTCTAIIVTMIGVYGLNPPLWFIVVLALGIIGLFAGWAVYRKKNVLTNEQKPDSVTRNKKNRLSKIFVNSVVVKILFSTISRLI
jgi:heme O synthase-like polyprenyltransferase